MDTIRSSDVMPVVSVSRKRYMFLEVMSKITFVAGGVLADGAYVALGAILFFRFGGEALVDDTSDERVGTRCGRIGHR